MVGVEDDNQPLKKGGEDIQTLYFSLYGEGYPLDRVVCCKGFIANQIAGSFGTGLSWTLYETDGSPTAPAWTREPAIVVTTRKDTQISLPFAVRSCFSPRKALPSKVTFPRRNVCTEEGGSRTKCRVVKLEEE